MMVTFGQANVSLATGCVTNRLPYALFKQNGGRPMSGPKRDPSRPHSRTWRDGTSSAAGLRVLPADCALPVPEPPPGCAWLKRSPEYRLWAQIWQGPHGNFLDESFGPSLAVYVAYSVRVLRGDVLKSYEAQSLRHLANDLGLTPAGLRALGFTTSLPQADLHSVRDTG